MNQTQSAASVDAAIDFAQNNAERFEQELFDLLRVPSVSTQPEHAADCVRAADLIVERLLAAGIEHAEAMTTPGHPIVYARHHQAGAEAPTVLIYGHYDVQPSDPLDEWETPPFEPTVRDGFVYARGSADDKGQAYVHVKAVESLLAADDSLPINVTFMIEGEEESGSSSLEPWIEQHAAQLAADVCVISDTHILSETQPSLITSLRGMSYCEVDLHGPAQDLHSGTFGGAVGNPAEALAKIIAQLKDEHGRIQIPGFYDDVRAPTDAERAELAEVPFDDAAFLADAGVPASVGEEGWTIYERLGIRPTLEVNGLYSGYIGEGAKTVLPARAMAKISMRLVADQDWNAISDAFERRIRELTPPAFSVEVRKLHGAAPARVDPTIPAMAAAEAAIEATYGVAPVLTSEGGSIPVVEAVERLLGMPTVLMGFGLPDDRLHSPNERFSLAQFHRGIETSIRFYANLARR